MKNCFRKCKGLGEGSVMEKRADSAARRNRKHGLGESQLAELSVQLKTRHLATATATPENSALPVSSRNSACESLCSDQASVYRLSSEESADLEETAANTFTTSPGDWSGYRERRKTTPSCTEQSKSNCCCGLDKIPSEAELEEFFTAAEKNLEKQFIDKYNYDIVKEQPVEGRYEWVQIQLKP